MNGRIPDQLDYTKTAAYGFSSLSTHATLRYDRNWSRWLLCVLKRSWANGRAWTCDPTGPATPHKPGLVLVARYIMLRNKIRQNDFYCCDCNFKKLWKERKEIFIELLTAFVDCIRAISNYLLMKRDWFMRIDGSQLHVFSMCRRFVGHTEALRLA